MSNIDERLLASRMPEMENEASRKLREEKRKASNGEEEDESEDEGGVSKSLREQRMEARKKKEQEIKKEKFGTGETATDELSKKASAQVLNSLWGTTASFVGFFPGFLGLNALAFLKLANIDLFKIVEKIKFRLGDKMGLALLDLLVVLIILIVLALFVLICNVIQNPLSYIGEALKMLWGRVVGK